MSYHVHGGMHWEEEYKEFAEEAAEQFAQHPDWNTYTNGEIGRGVLFAIKWGIDNHAVMVFRISDETPIVFPDFLKRAVMAYEAKTGGPYEAVGNP